MPNDADLVDQVLDWTAEPAIHQKIFVDNPVDLYGF
jgi:hypothetical protein